jgi:hypothetical protein
MIHSFESNAFLPIFIIEFKKNDELHKKNLKELKLYSIISLDWLNMYNKEIVNIFLILDTN